MRSENEKYEVAVVFAIFLFVVSAVIVGLDVAYAIYAAVTR